MQIIGRKNRKTKANIVLNKKNQLVTTKWQESNGRG
jgi:hypothetical protein